MLLLTFVVSLSYACAILAQSLSSSSLQACGEAYYYPSKYTCYDGDFLCPILEGQPTLRCGSDCYSPDTYSCDNGKLVYSPGTASGTALSTSPATCTQAAVIQHLSDPPYENYFYSDCHSSSQVVVTSPLENSNLTIIGPRLLVAWPAGNSGAVAFFQPKNGENGTLGISLVNGSSSSFELESAFRAPADDTSSGLPFVGVTSLVKFNSSAILTVPILGSIRTIRDFTEGPSIIYESIQNATIWSMTSSGGYLLSRRWLDNITTTEISFEPMNSENISLAIDEKGNKTLQFEAGTYNFTAWFDYPQLTQLNSSRVLNNKSRELIQSDPGQTTSLSFLSYSQKLLAGAWRFLTYFGRDSMIATLLLQPVFSEGEGGAIEAVIGAVLERLNRTSGFVCHEETIGDYSTFINLKNNVTGPDAAKSGCTYQMIDTQFYLAPIVESYFLRTDTGRSRREAFFATKATSDFGNDGLTYEDLLLINAEAVVNMSKAFAQEGGQTKDNLIHLEKGEIVGQWRDSTYGIGGGRIPYDVNTGLVPAALRAISALSTAGYFPSHSDWAETTARYAQVWEDETLEFFKVTIPASTANTRVQKYTSTAGFGDSLSLPNITTDITFHGLALEGNNNLSIVEVMNTDDCFRLYLSNTTNDAQLTSFLNQTASNILAPFPIGLSNPVGLLIANPAYGSDPVYAANWTNNAYHGTVVWSWQLAMMAAGLERQLSRCSSGGDSSGGDTPTTNGTIQIPAFCTDSAVKGNVLAAYNHLWDLIEANEAYINNEVWSWIYDDGTFTFEPLGALPPPAGLNPTESNVRQLWSLTWLAVKRDLNLK